MSFLYCHRRWQPRSTESGGDSFFHAAFGKSNDLQACFDPLARVRRMQWSAFLTYFESNTMPTRLEEHLRVCFMAKGDSARSFTGIGDYTEDVLRSEHEIHIEELPVLAPLLNVRIVLFVDGNGTPNVFEPNSDLLGDYPIGHISQLVEAVVWLEKSDFVQLQAVQTEPTEHSAPLLGLRAAEPSITPPTHRHKTTKQVDGIAGMVFKINLLAVLLTNGIKKFPNWRLATDKKHEGYIAEASYLGDIVFELLPSKEAILVPAQFYATEFLDDEFEAFRKLYVSYTKMRDEYKIRNVILCTYIDFKLEGPLRHLLKRNRLEEDSIFYCKGVESWCYACSNISYFLFIKDRLWESSPEKHFFQRVLYDKHMREFLDHFQIIVLYPSESNFDKVIESTVLSLGYSDQFDSKDYSQHLIKKIIDWIDEENGSYLTEVDAKAFLCEYRSKKFCEKLHEIKIHFKAEELTFDTVKGKRILHIVPHREYTLNLIKVYRFLQGKGVKSLFVNPGDSVNIQRYTVEAFEVPKYAYLVICTDTKNEEVIGEMCDKLTRILNTYTWKIVIMIAGKDNRCVQRMAIRNEDLYKKLEDTISFTDLTEQSQEKLLEEAIMISEANL